MNVSWSIASNVQRRAALWRPPVSVTRLSHLNWMEVPRRLLVEQRRCWRGQQNNCAKSLYASAFGAKNCFGTYANLEKTSPYVPCPIRHPSSPTQIGAIGSWWCLPGTIGLYCLPIQVMTSQVWCPPMSHPSITPLSQQLLKVQT